MPTRLSTVSGGEDERFSGYAPVLDAICEYALDPEQTNPSSRLSDLEAETQVELVEAVASAILAREQRKLLDQLTSKFSQVPTRDLAHLYSPSEQRERLIRKLLRLPLLETPAISDPQARESYSEMVDQFLAQHPFLDASGIQPANRVFAADLMIWGLFNNALAQHVRESLKTDSRYLSGVLFELYTEHLSMTPGVMIPLSDAGILYQALQSQMSTRQRALLDVASPDEDTVTVSFEVIDDESPAAERVYGPYDSSKETALELRAPFSHVYVDAPIWVSLGDGAVQQIGAPTHIASEALTFAAKQIFVHGSSGDVKDKSVFLMADECDSTMVQAVSVTNSTLTVSWPNARVHPWTAYASEPVPTADPDINFLRRRLRKILTSFRSHSKGNLVRFAPKIDSLRMTKDQRGANLVLSLVEDQILSLTDNGKFYVLDPDKLAATLGLDYHSLQQHRYNESVDIYLAEVIARGLK